MLGVVHAGSLLGGIVFRADWPLHVASNNENDAHITASSTSGGNAPWHVHDGDISNDWQGAGTVGEWIQVRFDSYRRVTAYTVKPVTGGSTGGWSFDFQGSTDGVSWTTLDSNSVAGVLGAGLVNQPITNQTPFLFYRLILTAVSNAFAEFAEWSMTFSAV